MFQMVRWFNDTGKDMVPICMENDALNGMCVYHWMTGDDMSEVTVGQWQIATVGLLWMMVVISLTVP